MYAIPVCTQYAVVRYLCMQCERCKRYLCVCNTLLYDTCGASDGCCMIYLWCICAVSSDMSDECSTLLYDTRGLWIHYCMKYVQCVQCLAIWAEYAICVVSADTYGVYIVCMRYGRCIGYADTCVCEQSQAICVCEQSLALCVCEQSLAICVCEQSLAICVTLV